MVPENNKKEKKKKKNLEDSPGLSSRLTISLTAAKYLKPKTTTKKKKKKKKKKKT